MTKEDPIKVLFGIILMLCVVSMMFYLMYKTFEYDEKKSVEIDRIKSEQYCNSSGNVNVVTYEEDKNVTLYNCCNSGYIDEGSGYKLKEICRGEEFKGDLYKEFNKITKDVY